MFRPSRDPYCFLHLNFNATILTMNLRMKKMQCAITDYNQARNSMNKLNDFAPFRWFPSIFKLAISHWVYLWEIHWQSLPLCRVLLLLSLSQWLIHFWKLHKLCRQDFRSEKLNPITNTTLYFLPESYASFLSKTRSFKLNTKKLFLWHCSLQKSIYFS